MIVNIVKQLEAASERVAPEDVGSQATITAFLNNRESIFIGDENGQDSELEAGDGIQVAGQSLPGIYAHGTPTVYDLTDAIPGSKTFKFLLNSSEFFIAGDTIEIVGSTANDGTYTVASASFGAGKTSVVVNETIPDATGDGDLLHGDKLAILLEA